MSANVTILSKSELCGREFTVYGTPEAPLFLAKEVAEIIGHSDFCLRDLIDSTDEICNDLSDYILLDDGSLKYEDKEEEE